MKNRGERTDGIVLSREYPCPHCGMRFNHCLILPTVLTSMMEYVAVKQLGTH